MVRLSRLEQETTITWNAEESIANVYTEIPATINKLDKLANEYPGTYKCIWVSKDGLGKRYEVAKKFIGFKKPASEECKQKRRAIAIANGLGRSARSDKTAQNS